MVIVPKAIYRLSTIAFKIPAEFFTKLETIIFHFTRKYKKSRIAKLIWNNKIPDRGLTIPGLRLYYRAIVIKTICMEIFAYQVCYESKIKYFKRKMS